MPKKMPYQVKALAEGKAVLHIYGDIGEDYWAEESNDAKTIVDKLSQIDATHIDVRLFSYGGSVADAVAIFNALDRHPASIDTFNDGVCMSAMSLIYMVGENRYAAANSMLMIHAPMIGAHGNAVEHRRVADMLDMYADAMNSSYMRSGQATNEIDALLKDGVDHYYTAESAVSDGFATEITDAVEIAASGVNPDRYSLPAAWVAANNLKKKDKTMPKKQASAAAAPNAVPQTTATAEPTTVPAESIVSVDNVKAEALREDKERRDGITAAFEPFKSRDGVTALMDTLKDDSKVSVDAASQQLLIHLGKESAPMAGSPHIEVGSTQGQKFVTGAANAILGRTGVIDRESGNQFNGMTMLEMARESLAIAGVNHRGLDKREIVGAALTHSSSDFPMLLENVMHKTLLTAYRAREFTWQRFCKVGNLSDFRPHGRYSVGSFGNLDSLKENGEFKHKSIGDAMKESIQLATKGNLINISRQMIINDDMGVLVDLVQNMSHAAGRTVESAVYAFLASNPYMGDTKKLFLASRGNLAGSGSVVTSSSLTAAKLAMKKQKDMDGNDYLDIIPTIFVGSDASAEDARKINEMKYDDDANQNQEKPNTNRGLFNDIIGNPRVGNEWYLFADPMDAPVLEVGFLDGIQDPYLELKDNYTTDGGTYKVRHDFGVGAVGTKGGYKNPGA